MTFLKNVFEDKYEGEHQKAARWLMIAYIISGFLLWGILIMIFPISNWVNNDFDMSVFHSIKMQKYFRNIFNTAGFYVLWAYYEWIMAYVSGHTTAILPIAF